MLPNTHQPDKQKHLDYILGALSIQHLLKIADVVYDLKRIGHGSVELRVKDGHLRFVDIKTSEKLEGEDER